MRKLIAPAACFALTWSAWMASSRWLGEPRPEVRAGLEAALWIASTWMASRIVASATRMEFNRRSGHLPPRLLLDLIVAAIWLGSLASMAVFVFGVTPSAAVTTSGMLIAVVGFAVRSLVADLFWGVTMAMERPFEIGNWIGLRDGATGRVVEMTWRAVKLVTRDNLKLIVPNSQLATEMIINYDQPEPIWRSSLRITLAYDVTAEQVARLLTSAVHQVTESAEVPRPPDALITGYEEHGVIWELRFWLPDYGTSAAVTQRVHEALLRNLHFAGIAVPRPREEVLIGPLEQERLAEAVAVRDWIQRIDVFAAIPLEDRARLQAQARRHEVPPAHEIVRQGEAGSSLFVLHEGTLEVWIENGAELERAAILKPGDVFGEMSLLTGAPRSATVRTASSAIVHEVTREDLEPLMRRHPELAREMAACMAERQFADTQRDAARSEAEIDIERKRATTQILERVRRFFKLPAAADRGAPDRSAARRA